MHIVFLTPEYVTKTTLDGGLANYVRQIARGLTDAGHRVTVLLLSNSNTAWLDGSVQVQEVCIPLSKAGFLRGLPLGTAALQLAAARSARCAALDLHRRTPITILQTSSFGTPGLRLLNNGYFPVVCRLSSLGTLWRKAYGRVSGLTDPVMDALERRQIRGANTRFAPSFWLARQVEREMGVSVDVVRTPCSLDNLHVDPSYYNQKLRGRRYLLFFGTLSRIKGVDVLAQVMPGVLGSNPDLHFVTCGRDDGLGRGRSALETLSKAFEHQSGRFHAFPVLSKPALIPIIRNAWAVLMPSRVDNYPNACLEAQSAGVPVIGTDDSSLEEMIEPGVTGFLARNGSEASLADAIRELLSLSPEAHAAMCERVLQSDSRRRHADPVGQHLQFYARVATQGLSKVDRRSPKGAP